MKTYGSIPSYIYWSYLIMLACTSGIIAAGQTGSSTANQMKLQGTQRRYALVTMQRILFFCCFAITLVALVCSNWHVVSWKHGILTLHISTQLPVIGLALWLTLMCVTAVSTTLLMFWYANVFLPSKPPKTFRKTRLIRKRGRPL